jgi:hypothetical protein
MEIKLHKGQPDNEAYKPTIYHSMIGGLMYATTGSHPDIQYAIGDLSWYIHDPSIAHMVALKPVFRYLNRTKDWGPYFGGPLERALRGALRVALGASLGESTHRGEGEGEGVLRCYVDSGYAGCLDNSKSRSGLGITFGGAVDWRSRKQKSTA